MVKSRFVEYMEYIPARIIMFALRILPYRLAVAAGAAFGMLVYILAPGQRRIVRKNLAIAYEDSLSDLEKRKLSRRIFRNLGKTTFEFMQFPKLSPEAICRMVKVENAAFLEEASAEGRGVIVITAHMGNWEYLATVNSACGPRPFYAVVRLLDNRKLDRYVESFREAKGLRIIPRGAAMRQAVRALKAGDTVAFVMDQNSVANPVFVPFFGVAAATVQGPAVLAMRYKAPVMLCYDVRNADNTHTLRYEKAIPFVEGKDEADTIALNMARYTEAIETVVRRYPEQWLWLHPRWRTRPEGGEALY